MAQQEHKTIPNRTVADWSFHLSRPAFLERSLIKHRFHDTFNLVGYRLLISLSLSRGHTIFDSVLTESRSNNTWLAAEDDYTRNWFSNKHSLDCVRRFCCDAKFSLTHNPTPYVDYIFVRVVQEISKSHSFFLAAFKSLTTTAHVLRRNVSVDLSMVCVVFSFNSRDLCFTCEYTHFLPEHLIRKKFDSEMWWNVWSSMYGGRVDGILGRNFLGFLSCIFPVSWRD